MNRKRNLVSAIALAAVGTLLLVAYVRTAEGRAEADTALVPVLVVTSDTPRGSTEDMLTANVELRQVPADARAADALTSLDSINGRVPATDLFAGEQLVADRLGDPTELGAELADGMVAVTLSLEPERALGGQVHAGTKVDVLASYDEPPKTETTVKGLEVLSVARSADQAATPPGADQPATDGVILVTLAVPAGQAEKLVYAADHGRLWLTGTDDVVLASAVAR